MGFGVLGASWIAGQAVIPALKASSNARVVTIASRDVNRAAAMAAAHDIPSVAGSYEAVIADPQVEVVYIPLTNDLHMEWTLKALAGGKHVLCEKPLAMNESEAALMAETAAASNRLLMEAFMYRFHPRVNAFVAGLDSMESVRARFGFPLTSPDNYRMVPERGGGALLDVGCYCVNIVRWILGEPEEVSATAHTEGVDLTVTAELKFANGSTASIWGSFESPEEQSLEVVSRTGVERLEKPFTSWRDPHDPYRLMVESFAASVMDGTPVALPLSDSIANMRALDRIRSSAGF